LNWKTPDKNCNATQAVTANFGQMTKIVTKVDMRYEIIDCGKRKIRRIVGKRCWHENCYLKGVSFLLYLELENDFT